MKRSILIRKMLTVLERSYGQEIAWLNAIYDLNISIDIHTAYDLSDRHWRIVTGSKAIGIRQQWDCLIAVSNAEEG